MSLFTEEGNYNCVITNDASKLRPRPVKKLLIRLISGHHLPKSADQKIKGNVIQPYVSLKLRGHVLDEAEFTTEVIPKVRNPENPKRRSLMRCSIFSERVQSNLGKLHWILPGLSPIYIPGISSTFGFCQQPAAAIQQICRWSSDRPKHSAFHLTAPGLPTRVFRRRGRSSADTGLPFSPLGCDWLCCSKEII